jgi:hypothetical protein
MEWFWNNECNQRNNANVSTGSAALMVVLESLIMQVILNLTNAVVTNNRNLVL